MDGLTYINYGFLLGKLQGHTIQKFQQIVVHSS